MILILRANGFDITLDNEVVFTKKSDSEYVFDYQQTIFSIKLCSSFWQRFLSIAMYVAYDGTGKTIGYLKMRALGKLEVNLTYEGRKIVCRLIFIRHLVKLERQFQIESTYYEYLRAGWMDKDDMILLKNNKRPDILHIFLGSFMLSQLSRIGGGGGMQHSIAIVVMENENTPEPDTPRPAYAAGLGRTFSCPVLPYS